jgi:hypothetical protein
MDKPIFLLIRDFSDLYPVPSSLGSLKNAI